MKRFATWLVVAGAVVVLGTANYTIWQRQQIVDHGRPVLLELRPVDPRSLIQGDYMALAYAETIFPAADERSQLPRRGSFIVTLDADSVATFARLDTGGSLAANEARIKYKLVDQRGGMRLGAESYFFQEGQADLFADAEFGVLHVDDAGNSVLIGLAGENKLIIQAPENETGPDGARQDRD
ncbi:MAG: GDYXXLXY domain-containing protein [Woeseiaceae bacterium]|nr:GDYXXLXY domain-containing protein [Woeseiaceae bacterium]